MKNNFWKIAVVLAGICGLQSCSGPSLKPTRNYGGAAKALVPNNGWTCGMAQGIPVPERGVPVFEATVQLGQIHDVGRTPCGLRKVLVTQGGTITGEKINGTVMSGGWTFSSIFPTERWKWSKSSC